MKRLKRRLDQIGQTLIGAAFGMLFAMIPLVIFLTLMPADVEASTKMWLTVYAGSIGGFAFGRFSSTTAKHPTDGA